MHIESTKERKFLIKKEKISEEENARRFLFIKEIYQEKMLDEVISLCTGRLQNYGNYDFFQNICKVLSPTKKRNVRNQRIIKY